MHTTAPARYVIFGRSRNQVDDNSGQKNEETTACNQDSGRGASKARRITVVQNHCVMVSSMSVPIGTLTGQEHNRARPSTGSQVNRQCQPVAAPFCSQSRKLRGEQNLDASPETIPLFVIRRSWSSLDHQCCGLESPLPCRAPPLIRS